MERHYFKRAWTDMRSGEHWFRKLMLLALISIIPVFGPITVTGYFYRWAKTAVDGGAVSMPEKVLGGPDDHQFLVGFRVFVVSLVIVGIPLLLLSVLISVCSAFSDSDGFFIFIAIMLSFVSVLASFFLGFLNWAATMRATMEGSIAAGLDIKVVWARFSSDVVGCVRIFLIGFVCSFVLSAFMSIVVSILIFLFTFAVMFMVAGDPQISALLAGLTVDPALTLHMLFLYIGPQLIGILVIFCLLAVIIMYFMIVASTFVNGIMTRCLGYWTVDSGRMRGDASTGVFP